MTTTPCTFALMFLLGAVLLPFFFYLFYGQFKSILRWVKRIEFQIPVVPRFFVTGLRYAIPITLLVVFFMNIHFVDCKTHQPISSLKDCHCEVIASK